MLRHSCPPRRWAAALLLALIGPAAAAVPSAVPSAIIVSAVAPVRPVLGADHRVHLAYELLVANPSDLIVTLESVAALDGASGAILSEIDGDDLAALWIGRTNAATATLLPGQAAFLVMDVALAEDTDPPRTFRHRFQTSQTASVSAGAGAAPKPERTVAPTVTFVGGEVAVERVPAVVLAPPLHGGGWLVTNGCCDRANPHRAALLAVDGRIIAPERFAIDFVQLQPDGRLFAGPADQLSSYKYFAEPVVAATDGVIVGLADDASDESPGAAPDGKTPAGGLGNYVVVVTDGGRYILYAHLKAGSINRKVGEPLKTGDRIGLLGNSGETPRPHLHFAVMDNPSPLAANGLPFVFRNFVGEGRLDGDETAVFKGEAAQVDKTALSGNHRRELPLNGEVVGFE